MKFGIIRVLSFSWHLVAVPALIGCGTLPNGGGWGRDATLTPGWNKLGNAAWNAAFSFETYAPALTALFLQVDHMDQRLSDWASDKTPLFASQDDADRWSSYLRNSAAAAYFVTSFATPSGEDPKEWSISKIKGISVGMTALGLTVGATDLLKEGTGRTRPDASDDRSLPSGHASAGGALTTLARRNVRTLSLSPTAETIANFGLVGIAAGTAWARVEAGEHYPSDVLVGYALGHFFSAFVEDAFLGLDRKEGPFFIVAPSKNGIVLTLNWPL